MNSIFEPLPDFARNMVMEHFPFPNARVNQAEVCWEVAKAYFRGKKFAVLSAPTGSGKSPIGMTVGQMISDNYHKATCAKNQEKGLANPEKKGSVILTRTRSLQQQYDDNSSGGKAAVLWGKTHYSDIDVDNPPDVVHTCSKTCPGMSYSHEVYECPHKIAKRNFMNPKNVGIANNALYLSAHDVREYPSVLVVDECHTFVDALIEYSEIQVNTRRIKSLMEKYNCQHIEHIDQCIKYEDELKEGRLVLKNIEGYLVALSDFVVDWVIPPVEEMLAAIEAYSNNDPRSLKRKTQIEKELKFLTKFVQNLRGCAGSAYARSNWVCWKVVETLRDRATGIEENVTRINLRPMDPLPEVVDYILSGKAMTIFMSATTGSYEEFCREMGLRPAEGVFFDLPSTFPIENRKVFSMNVGAMNHGNKSTLLGEDGDFTNMVRSILNQHKGVRGVIHTVSYDNAKTLKDNFGFMNEGWTRLVIVPRGTIVNADYLNSLPKDAVIMSPSVSEGVDLKDDLARFQIILKVPFGNLGDPWMKAKLTRSSEWYENRAATEVAQMIGRVVRSETDYGNTYILDSAFGRIKKHLPSYVKVAIEEM